MEISSIIPVERAGLYPMLPSSWDGYECPYLLFVLRPLVFSYYSELYLRSGSDNIRRILSLPISEPAVLAGVQFVLYATERSAPDYFVGSLRFIRIGESM